MANSLRGISSTIFLSYVSDACFYLKGWNSIIFYFNFPKILLYKGTYNITKIYNRFNVDIIKNLKKKEQIVVIRDIYGFLNRQLHSYCNYKKIELFKKIYQIYKINKEIVNSIIYKEFFQPSNIVLSYVNYFKNKKKNRTVIGLHLRSGIFNNYYIESYFSKSQSVNAYIIKAEEIIMNNNISHAFIISDNKKLLTIMKKHFSKIVIDIPFKGEIIHSRFSLYKKYINNDAIRIVAEFLILSNCDIIIGTKHSSFSYESCNIQMKYCVMI